ncbi:hypothetical protein CXB51_002212 [Gossypium anomalum]|uniref:Integrase catalytic domain-containing protein n=1 Tax=Gossypium anomalum TaxID=47600 RepID=A0A8J5ZHW3_9ROSI|nr:hypothetical protein CXB51_002212 [Gossypium anomalum]
MASDAAIFKSIGRSFKTRVKVGNGHFIKAEGKGDVLIDTPTGTKLVLNVLLVPEIDRNLLSIAQLLEKGYSVVFKGKECLISDPNGSKLMTVTMADKSFVVDWNKSSDSVYTAVQDKSKLWHKRLGHVNYNSMTQLTKEGLVENFTNSVEKEEVCEVCQLEKQGRLPFPTNKAWRASKRVQLVHTDVCGPMKNQSLNGSRYFILFIDDYSRYCWIYFLKQKSEVASVFLKFKTAAETETGCKLKTLRSDNGTEYTSSGLNMFYDETGIKHQLTNIYTPQQNGVSERKNRSLMDMARLPIKALAQKTPFEAWFGFKPSLAHLRVFGCVCYAHVPTAKREKLAKKAQPIILVGYSSINKGYRILDPSTNKVSVSRDVVFDEKVSWNWDKNEPETATEDLVTNQTEADQNGPEMDIDDEPVRGTRPLVEIYERAHVAIIEPSCFEEAEAHQGWKHAMADKISMIDKNQTWQLVERPLNRKVIGVKWVFRAKHNVDGILNKLKSRLVVKGFNQKVLHPSSPHCRTTIPPLCIVVEGPQNGPFSLVEALGADETPTTTEDVTRARKAGGWCPDWRWRTWQRKHAVVEEDKVYKLKKALYGLKQALRAWYSRIDGYLASLGFERSISEPTLYVKRQGSKTQLIVSLYVDDLLVTGGDQAMLIDFKCKMQQVFEMSDLGQMSYFLGMEVSQTQYGIFLSQKAFALKILNKFSMLNCKATSTPVAIGEKLSSQGDLRRLVNQPIEV